MLWIEHKKEKSEAITINWEHKTKEAKDQKNKLKASVEMKRKWREK